MNEQVIEAIKNLPDGAKIWCDTVSETIWEVVFADVAALKALVSELEQVKAEKEKCERLLSKYFNALQCDCENETCAACVLYDEFNEYHAALARIDEKGE